MPGLMTHLLRKQMWKDADVVFEIPVGMKFWLDQVHEPLVVLMVSPLTYIDSYQGP